MMSINAEKCIGCGKCVKDCFLRDIEMAEGKAKINNVACIKCGHCIAVCPQNAVTTDEYSMSDVTEYDKEDFTIEADNLLNFIKFRRTIRQFKNQEVEESKLLKIIEAGRFTQTGSNMQDVSYIIVRDGIQELKALTLQTLKQIGEHMIENITPETAYYERYAAMWIKMYEDYQVNPAVDDRLFFKAPVAIIITAKSEMNAGLAASNMELMTNALGLGTFFSGFFIRAAKSNGRIKEFLEVKEGKEIVACMVIGYPNVKYLRTAPRKEAEVCWK
jgi:nitroreductase/NAD-dependent dihydropyrimidine dehydrogenase PreA subunit